MRFSPILRDVRLYPPEDRPHNKFLPESYEGFLMPKTGRAPYRVIDDPALIEKKNAMRNALREEFTKRIFNPYRNAAGIGGSPTDPMLIRYNALQRTQHEFFRPGPKATFCGFMLLFGCPALLGYICESFRYPREYKRRTGQVTYAQRMGASGVNY